MFSRRIAAPLLALAVGMGVAVPATAGPFSGGIVTIVVGSSPGSSFDSAARIVAEPLSKAWGVPVVVENKPGASMMISAAHVAKAAPDGRTILFGATPVLQAPHLVRQPAYDPVTSFTPLAQLFEARLWFAVNARVPAKSLSEFIKLARKPDSHFSFSSPGTGSTPHLNTVLLMKQANITMLHVPYKAIPPAVMDVVTGQVTSVFASYSDLVGHAAAGKLRILASTGQARSPLSKDVPTFKESGLTGFDVVGFGGLLVPAGTPAHLAAEMSHAVTHVLQRTDVKARLFALGMEPVQGTQQDFARVIREQTAFWKKVVVDSGAKAD